MGAAGEAPVGGQRGEQRAVGGAHLRQLGALAAALAEFPDELDGERLAVGELHGSGPAPLPGGVRAVEALPHPIIDDAKDDCEEIDSAETVG